MPGPTRPPYSGLLFGGASCRAGSRGSTEVPTTTGIRRRVVVAGALHRRSARHPPRLRASHGLYDSLRIYSLLSPGGYEPPAPSTSVRYRGTTGVRPHRHLARTLALTGLCGGTDGPSGTAMHRPQTLRALRRQARVGWPTNRAFLLPRRKL